MMRPSKMRSWVIATVVAGSLATGPAARAERISFVSQANASNHVPSNSSTGTGTLTAVFDTDTKTLSWTIVYSGLSGPPLAAHFHGPAPAGRNAGIAVPITGNLASPITGTATLTDSQAADLMAAQWYLNLHTAVSPSGEIRGQVVRAP